MGILQDSHQQHDLPHTGVSLAWEKLLSSIFIQSTDYGTRCSNILMMSPQHLEWVEKIQAGKQCSTISSIYYLYEKYALEI